MSSSLSESSRRSWGLGAGVALAAAGVAIALALAMTSGAAARSATLGVVTAHLNGPSGKRTEPIVTTSRGVAVYELSGDSTTHPLCTAANGCFSFWPPVKLGSGARLTKAAGVSGRLGTWHRDGFTQVTLNGHPLYTFTPDGGRRGVAAGDGVRGFGGVWHVFAAGSAHRAAAVSAPMSSSASSSGSGY